MRPVPFSSTQNTSMHFNFNSQHDAPSLSEQTIHEEDEPTGIPDDQQQRNSSPDPLDFLGGNFPNVPNFSQEDALITQSLAELAQLAEPDSEFLDLQGALQYAFASKLQTGKPSEPTH